MKLTAAVIAGLAAFGAIAMWSEPSTNSANVAWAQQDNFDRQKATSEFAAPKSDFLKEPELFPKFLAAKSRCNFEDTPLADALQALAEDHEFEYVLKAEAVESEGVTVDSPITLKLDDEQRGDVTVEEILNLTLWPLNLAWRVDGEVLIVSSIDDLNSHYLTKQYDLTRTLKVGHRIESIQRALRTSLGSGWEEDGRGRGTITARGNTLFIRQSYQEHRMISRLLAALESPQRIAPLTTRSNTAKIRAALRTKWSHKFVDTPLNDAVTYLSTLFEIHILLDTQNMDAAGIPADTPVTLELTNKPLSQWLQLMLVKYGLTTIQRDGVLMVTTKDAVQQRFETVVYDVAELVMDGPVFLSTEPNSITRCLCNDIKQAALIELIRKNTTAYWEPESAPWPSIEPLETGLLVIHQTQAVHDEIAALLTPLIHQAIAERARTGADKPGPPKLILRSYLISKETAADLDKNLKDLVVVPSWGQPVGGELPAVYVVAAEPRLEEVNVKVVAGPYEVRTEAPGPKPESEKRNGFYPAEGTKNYIVRPQSHLMIRQTPENHREIERFLRELTGLEWLRGTTPGAK